jgi:hypothetical protein
VRYGGVGLQSAESGGVTHSALAATIRYPRGYAPRGRSPSMDKRFFLALLLTAIVIVVPPLFLQNKGRSPAVVTDSTTRSVVRPDSTVSATPANGSVPAALPTLPPSSTGQATTTAALPVLVETTTVRTRLSRYAFSSRGAAPVSVVLDSYPSRRPTSSDPKAASREYSQPSELLPAQASLVRFRLALGRDTIALDTIPLRAELKQ